MIKHPTVCIYHANCVDGFTAAWLVWKRFGDSVRFIPGVYGEEPPDLTGERVVMVDFSYKRAVLEKIIDQAAVLIVLDHHKTAQEDLAPLTIKTWDSIYACSYFAVFDMERSGAKLALDFFHYSHGAYDLGVETLEFVRLVEDRDLWRFTQPETKAFHAYLSSIEMTFENWDKVEYDLSYDRDAVFLSGQAILRVHEKTTRELVAATRNLMRIDGFYVPVANLPYNYASDAGHIMSESEVFAATYYDTATHRVFSLRSQEGGHDVSKVAQKYGGGGHKHAAGFRIDRLTRNKDEASLL